VTVKANGEGKYTLTSPKGLVPSGKITATENTNPTPATHTYQESAPTATITQTSTNTDGSVTVTGEATPNSTVKVTMPNGSEVTAQASSTGKYTVSSKAGVAMPGGSVQAIPSVNGVSGKTAQGTYSAPPVTIANVTAGPDGKVTVSGSATPGATVSVRLPGDATPVTVKANGEGKYTLTSPKGLVPSGKITATENTNPTPATHTYQESAPTA
ncbi:MAG: hypothetical protein GY914_09445, partial [Prochlorococcus sp.]|nr:hypothetical protein [Prochlorococcus sp.]